MKEYLHKSIAINRSSTTLIDFCIMDKTRYLITEQLIRDRNESNIDQTAQKVLRVICNLSNGTFKGSFDNCLLHYEYSTVCELMCTQFERERSQYDRE